jgi:hypothetical protein
MRLPARDLGGPKVYPPPAKLGERTLHLDRTRVHVDVCAPQCRQLAPAEAAEDSQQDERPVALADRVGQREDLRHGENRPLG